MQCLNEFNLFIHYSPSRQWQESGHSSIKSEHQCYLPAFKNAFHLGFFSSLSQLFHKWHGSPPSTRVTLWLLCGWAWRLQKNLSLFVRVSVGALTIRPFELGECGSILSRYCLLAMMTFGDMTQTSPPHWQSHHLSAGLMQLRAMCTT